MTCQEILRLHACRQPARLAVICQGRTLTYLQLLERAEAEALRLQEEEHACRGQIYQFKARQDIDFVIRFLALHFIGAICTPVDAFMPLPSFHDDNVSDILFTTGSSGKPKGVLLSWDAVMADVENLTTAHGYHQDLTFVICGPVHHFGCWSKLVTTLCSGATLYLLEGLKDVEALLSALSSATRTATFLVPSAIRMLIQLNAERLAALAGNIEFIETGAAPISVGDMERLRELLPRTRLYNTYASTETGVVCTYPFHAHASCMTGCVGPAMQHARIHLDETGHIIVAGPMIMTGYLPGAASPAEIITSDIGRIDEKGNLFITGRDSDFINVGGLKVAPAEVEDMVMSLPEIGDCICIASTHPMMGQVPKLLVVMNPGCEFDKRSLIQYLKEHLEPFKIPLLYEEVSEVKKTFNGKKNRKFYR